MQCSFLITDFWSQLELKERMFLCLTCSALDNFRQIVDALWLIQYRIQVQKGASRAGVDTRWIDVEAFTAIRGVHGQRSLKRTTNFHFTRNPFSDLHSQPLTAGLIFRATGCVALPRKFSAWQKYSPSSSGCALFIVRVMILVSGTLKISRG
jgi:hypothetical protein